MLLFWHHDLAMWIGFRNGYLRMKHNYFIKFIIYSFIPGSKNVWQRVSDSWSHKNSENKFYLIYAEKTSIVMDSKGQYFIAKRIPIENAQTIH